MKLFADDVKLYSSFTHSLCDLKIVCDRLATWAEKWQLRIDCSPEYKIGTHVLHWSDETRDL